jgi:predicted porin
MQNRIKVMAITAVMSTPVLADTFNVNVYGNVDVSYDSIKTGNATNGTTGVTSNRVASNISYLGVKGANDLGDGLSALWQIESLVNIGNAGATQGGNFQLGNRDTYAALKNADLGTLLAGRYSTPYKLSTYRLDTFVGGIADNRSLLGSAGYSTFDGRQDQTLAYISPNWGGLTVMAARANLAPAVSSNLTAPATVPAAGTTPLTANANANVTSIAAWYDAHGFYGALAYEAHNNLGINSAGATQSEHATRLGLAYTEDGIYSVGAVAEKIGDNLGSSAAGVGGSLDGHDTYYLSGKYYLPSDNIIKVAYTKLGSLTNGAPNTGAAQLALGLDHVLNKRTTVYALYTRLHNDSAASYGLSTSSITSVGGVTTLSGVGASPSAIAVGVKVVF